MSILYKVYKANWLSFTILFHLCVNIRNYVTILIVYLGCGIIYILKDFVVLHIFIDIL